MRPDLMTSLRYCFTSLFFCAICLAGTFGCSLSQPKIEHQRENLIGRPPTPDQDDPFFARALPAEAIPAEPAGQIGATPTEHEPPPPHEHEPPHEAATDTQIRACFSCIQLCPLDEQGRAQCGNTADDLICGWGSHTDTDTARDTAQAHCDATLDMARQMPTYSEISGACPIATCR